jgi:fatty-acyl-CoA synthase
LSYFGHFIDVWAKQRPTHTAVHFQGVDYSYAWLASEIEWVSAGLAAKGISKSSRVAYLGLNHPCLLVLLFALARQGAMLVPLNYRLTAHEHAQQLLDATPSHLFFDEPFAAHSIDLCHHVNAQDPRGRCKIAGHSIDEIQSAMLDQRRAQSQVSADQTSVTGSYADDLLLVYTSGTTGAPKGAVLTQNALLWNALNSVHAHDLASRDRVLIALPMFHVGGMNIMLTPALYVGATVAIEAKFDAGQFLKLLAEWRPTLSLLVPATIAALVAHAEWQSTDVSSLRLINTGSSIVPKPLLEAWHSRGIPAAQVYGSTETAPIAIYLRQEDTARKLGSAGLPALHCEAKLVGQDGQLCKTGDVGEILVKGPNVMRAYWNNPEATQQAFEDGWFKTGDLAYQDADGYYWVVGRSKDMIISGGENIYPAEIEALILNHPAVAECAVIGMADSRWGEVPVLVVVLKAEPQHQPEPALLATLIQQQLENKLARYKWPKQVIQVFTLPKTALGKVKKDQLRLTLESQTTASL